MTEKIIGTAFALMLGVFWLSFYFFNGYYDIIRFIQELF